MSVATLKEIVTKHPFWRGLNPADLHLLEECANLEHFEAGQLIFQEGQEADRFYLIQTGQVRLDAFVPGRGTVTVQTLTDGDPLGWSWLFPPYR
jgi:CRP/FNR family transcriptional regulator, cyclic AMP receptor protein